MRLAERKCPVGRINTGCGIFTLPETSTSQTSNKPKQQPKQQPFAAVFFIFSALANAYFRVGRNAKPAKATQNAHKTQQKRP